MPTFELPYVSLATLCERALVETDGVLSLIRLIDRVRAPLGRPAVIRLSLVLGLKSEAPIEEVPLLLRLQTPSQGTALQHEGTLSLPGGGEGTNLVTQLDLSLQERGLYWFEFVIDQEKLLTRIPFTVDDDDDEAAAPAPGSETAS